MACALWLLADAQAKDRAVLCVQGLRLCTNKMQGHTLSYSRPYPPPLVA